MPSAAEQLPYESENTGLNPELPANAENDVLTPLDLDGEVEAAEGFDHLPEEESEEDETVDSDVNDMVEFNGVGLYAESVDQFLAGAGKHRILKAAEEVVLAKTMEKGKDAARRLQEMESAGELSEELRAELEKLEHAGNFAKKEMMECNLKLVVSIVKVYANNGVPLGELINEGVTGLSRAADKFDWRRGFKFSTYATWWIRQSAQRAVANQGRTIRMPVHVVERVLMIRRAEYDLTAELQRPPTEEEITERTQLPPRHVAEALMALRRQPTSLNQRVGDEEDGGEFGDFLHSKMDSALVMPSAEEEAQSELVNHTLRQALNQLPERERWILEQRFGMNEDGEATSLEEIGRRLGITRERVRQIEKESLKKLRSSKILRGIE